MQRKSNKQLDRLSKHIARPDEYRLSSSDKTKLERLKFIKNCLNENKDKSEIAHILNSKERLNNRTAYKHIAQAKLLYGLSEVIVKDKYQLDRLSKHIAQPDQYKLNNADKKKLEKLDFIISLLNRNKEENEVANIVKRKYNICISGAQRYVLQAKILHGIPKGRAKDRIKQLDRLSKHIAQPNQYKLHNADKKKLEELKFIKSCIEDNKNKSEIAHILNSKERLNNRTALKHIAQAERVYNLLAVKSKNQPRINKSESTQLERLSKHIAQPDQYKLNDRDKKKLKELNFIKSCINDNKSEIEVAEILRDKKGFKNRANAYKCIDEAKRLYGSRKTKQLERLSKHIAQPDQYELNNADKKKLKWFEFIISYVRDNRDDGEIFNILKNKKGLRKSTAYRYIANAKYLFGSFTSREEKNFYAKPLLDNQADIVEQATYADDLASANKSIRNMIEILGLYDRNTSSAQTAKTQVIEPYDSIADSQSTKDTTNFIGIACKVQNIAEKIKNININSSLNKDDLKSAWHEEKADRLDYDIFYVKRNIKPWKDVRRMEACKFTTKDEIREAVFEAHGSACLACGATDKSIHLDHIVPVARGGTDSLDNLQPLCINCNTSKSTKIIDYT